MSSGRWPGDCTQVGVCATDSYSYSTLLAAIPLLAPAALAQETQLDAITRIDGEVPTTDAATIYFNAENCADAANTVYDVTLVNGDGVTQIYMWAGVQNGECQLNDKRTDLQLLCRPMASSNPRTVGDNATVFDLTLQELVDTGVVDCSNRRSKGSPTKSIRSATKIRAAPTCYQQAMASPHSESM